MLSLSARRDRSKSACCPCQQDEIGRNQHVVLVSTTRSVKITMLSLPPRRDPSSTHSERCHQIGENYHAVLLSTARSAKITMLSFSADRSPYAHLPPCTRKLGRILHTHPIGHRQGTTTTCSVQPVQHAMSWTHEGDRDESRRVPPPPPPPPPPPQPPHVVL
jgi:hypothetical protein